MLHQPLPDDIARRLAAHAAALGAFARVPQYHACVSSTNDVAARLAEAGAPEGAWVLADEQTAGRGRRGRTWASPPGAGLYLSVVFRPTVTGPASGGTFGAAGPSTEEPVVSVPVAHGSAPNASVASRAIAHAHDTRATSLLTIMAGVAAATSVRAATGLAPTLKWPNDVVIEPPASPGDSTRAGFSRFRKLAGILAEASATGGDLQFVVMGIGINLTPAAYPPDVAARATSIEGELGRPADRALVLIELLSALADGRRALLDGRADDVLRAWRASAPSSIGRRVRWQAGGPRAGVTQGIDETGALLVRTENGAERIIAGDVEWE